MDMEFTRLKIDKSGKLTSDDVRVSIDSVSALVSKKTARLDIFKMSIHPDSMVIHNLHFRHIVDRYAINRIKGFRASWLDVQVSDFRLLGLHPLMLTNDSIIDIDKVSIGDLQLLLFKDKSDLVINPAHKALPPEEIRSIPVKLKIDTVEILHGDLTVEMQAPDAKRPGKITLNHFNAGIFNITNIPEYLVSKPEMELFTKFALMDSARINLTAGFRIDSPEDQFRVTCKAEPFNIQILNEFLGSQFFIDFSSGFIKGLNFEFEGNNKANVGTMDLEYNDLKIEKYQNFKRYIDSKPHTGFIAFMGNTLIPNNRSKEDPHYKPAVIYYEKEYNRDFIHGTIMSLLSGLSSTMGFSGHNLEKQEEKARELDASDIKKSEEVAEKKAEKAEEKAEKDQEKKEKANRD
jgi:hypothetical protein